MTLRRNIVKDPNIKDEDRVALAELAKTDRAAFAEVIMEYVDPVYLTLDIAKAFMQTREMSWNEMHVKRFKGKYHVQQIVPGQITLGEQITVRDKAVSMNLDILSAKAAYSTLELAHGGPQFTPETIKADVQAALQEKVLMRTWNALANIWTTANASALTYPGAAVSNFIDCAGPLTSTALDNAIDHVNFWSGSVRSIIGTEQALAPLSTFGQYRVIGAVTDTHPGILQTLDGQTPGSYRNISPYAGQQIESYRGVTNIIRVPQIFDKSEYPPVALLPTDFVLVVGEDIGEFITYGGPQFKEYTDNEPTPPNWTFETWLQFGMMIWNARGLVKVKCTSVVP